MKIFLNKTLSQNRIDFTTSKTSRIQNIEIILQGDIHNFAEIIEGYSAKDIETAFIHMYKSNGFRHAVFMLDGEFSVVLYDHEKQELYVARDPYGACPIYIVPPVLGSTIWEITDKSGLVPPVASGTYSFFDKNAAEWRLRNTHIRFHHMPTPPLAHIKYDLSTGIHFVQYIKFALQKRILPFYAYYINYETEGESLRFILAWCMHQLFPQTEFYIYVNSYDDIPPHWQEVFGDKIRLCSLNTHDRLYEISTEHIFTCAYPDESPRDYEMRVRNEIYFQTSRRIPASNKCIYPLMDAALMEFYLTQIPTEIRMSDTLLNGNNSIIPYIPALMCKV